MHGPAAPPLTGGCFMSWRQPPMRSAAPSCSHASSATRDRMPLVSTDAIILQVFRYGETSKIARLLTRTHGVQSVIAKGAANPKSKYGGILEPFTEGVATFYAKDNRDLHTLGSFELLRSRQSLGSDLIRFGGASLIAELIMRSGIEEPDADLYD